MRIFALTRQGPGKTENEDRIIVGAKVIDGGAFSGELDFGTVAVADGVGGNRGGSAASSFVAERVCLMNDMTAEALKAVNDELLAFAEASEDKKTMATTLSGLCFADGHTRLFCIGNTRVYLIRGGKYLKQLTSDDTTVNYLLSLGRITPDEAMRFERKNEITACFGGGDVALFRIKVSDAEGVAAPFVMTSDGVHDHLSVDEMEEIISASGMCEQTCEALIAAARANGSFDDASVVLGCV